jgi:hypothetical protein
MVNIREDTKMTEVPLALRNSRSPDEALKSDPALSPPYVEQQIDQCMAAFTQWEAARQRTDRQLYEALGKLYVLMTLLVYSLDTLKRIAWARGLHVTKASNPSILLTRLVLTENRQKVSKYAGILRFLEARLIEPKVDAVVDFIKVEGGVEVCLRIFRQEMRRVAPPRQTRRLSPYLLRLWNLPYCELPAGLHLDSLSEPYFLLVGLHDDSGRGQLINHPVQDKSLILRAISGLEEAADPMVDDRDG